MIKTTINISAEQELAALQKTLGRYHEVSKRDIAETLAKKANDIRIQLYRGYWEQRYKGPRKGARQSEGVAFKQMRQRAKNDRGITLRPSLANGAPSPQAPVEYFQRRKLRGKYGKSRTFMVPVKMSTYQRRVWTELARRQSGIGVLGVAFLMQRYKRNFGKFKGNDRFRANKTSVPSLEVMTQEGFQHRLLGRVTLAPTFARIEGMVPGQAQVSGRYSILAMALRGVREDTEVYLARKTAESLKEGLAA